MLDNDTFSLEDISDILEEFSDEPKIKSTNNSFTWSTDLKIEYKLIGYTIQNYPKQNAKNWFTIEEKNRPR